VIRAIQPSGLLMKAKYVEKNSAKVIGGSLEIVNDPGYMGAGFACVQPARD
jgi:hypothetical protein